MISAPEIFIEAKRYESIPFSDDEINQLARARILDCSADDFVFRIVGAITISRRVIYVLPKFESSENCNVEAGQRYVKVLDRYFRSSSARSNFSSPNNLRSSLFSTFQELNSYYTQYGIYKELFDVDATASRQKVNWAKTIKKNKSIVSDLSAYGHGFTSVIYSTPVSVISSEVDGDIAHMFEVVLSLLATHLAPVLSINHPMASTGGALVKVHAEIERVVSRANYYSRLLTQRGEAASGPRKRVLTALFDILRNDGSMLKGLLGSRPLIFGTADFEYVWEEACLTALGAERNSKLLAQPRMQTTTNIDVFVSSQRVDGIIVSDNPDYASIIVDAKYYVSRADQIRFSSVDIMKQFGYALSARSSFERDEIGNALLLPGEVNQVEICRSLGEVRLEMDGAALQDVDDVHVLLLNPTNVVDAYLKGSRDLNLLTAVRDAVGKYKNPAAGDLAAA